MEVLQYGEAKWGDHDNDNVRSALAGGLLRLMDALIISKQELQWSRVCVRACDNCPFSIRTYAKSVRSKREEKSALGARILFNKPRAIYWESHAERCFAPRG